MAAPSAAPGYAPAMHADLQAALETTYGPLREVGRHAGVVVFRRDDAEAPVLKVHADTGHGRGEVELLRALAEVRGLVVPAVRFVDAAPGDGGVMGMDDVRAGRDGRLHHLGPEQIPAAARVLAALHAAPLPGFSGGDPAERVARASRDPALPEALRERLRALCVVGDAVCHGDLHPSNWITEGGRAVGLLDWASALRMDPEWDLAGLLLAARGTASIDAVCSPWNAASGQVADPTRVHLYAWWMATEEAARNTGKPWIEALVRALAAGEEALPPAHGGTRVERAVPEVHGDGFWVEVPAGADPVLEALRRPSVLGRGPRLEQVERYGGHACNDVLRLRVDGTPRVVKVYNKPVPSWLFPLERHLSRNVRDGATVLAPQRLAGGGDLFRVGGRPAAIYADAGQQRVGNSKRDAELQARALGALHRVSGLAERFPALREPAPHMDWPLVVGDVGERVDPGLLEGVRRAWMPVEADWAMVDDPALPEALQHGSLHRDHTALAPDGSLVIFDLEKARIGPAVDDVVRTAAFVGYRGNDETFDPGRIVGFLRTYHQRRRLSDAERAALFPLLIRCLVHDLRAMAQEDHTDDDLARHCGVIAMVAHNRANLEAAVRRYLD